MYSIWSMRDFAQLQWSAEDLCEDGGQLVTSCSCPSVASQKNLRWYAPEKPYSTGTPGTARCHQPALRWGQEGNGRLRRQWRWQSHAWDKRHWWAMCRQAEQVWATSQRPGSARPVARKYTIYSRKRSEQAWRKSEWAGRWDSGSRERGPGGKVHCSAGLPGQTSCRQISIGSVSWYKLSMIPCQAQRISMSGGRARHLLAFFALEEAL